MAGEVAAPAAKRVVRPGWRDPRLGIGVLLVASSVALGAWTVRGVDNGVPVYAARDVLTPGESLAAADLTVVEARLAPHQEAYLRADAPLPSGAVVTRVVGSGELVPLQAVGTADAVDVRPVGVVVGSAVSGSVVKGAAVDLWLTPSPSRATGAPAGPVEPVLVARALRVADVRAAEGLFAAAGSTSVEVLVPAEKLPAVLAARAQDGDLALVPLPGGA